MSHSTFKMRFLMTFDSVCPISFFSYSFVIVRFVDVSNCVQHIFLYRIQAASSSPSCRVSFTMVCRTPAPPSHIGAANAVSAAANPSFNIYCVNISFAPDDAEPEEEYTFVNASPAQLEAVDPDEEDPVELVAKYERSQAAIERWKRHAKILMFIANVRKQFNICGSLCKEFKCIGKR